MTVALLTTIAALTDVFSLVDAGLTPLTTDNVALCNGEPAVIPWSYDDETHISAVTWSKDGAQVMFYLGGSLTVINTKYEFDNATSNAGLKVKTVESTSAGIYTCSVGYQVGFSAPEQRTLDLSGEYITTPPAAPTGSCTEQESSTYLCTCSVTDLGNPAAALQIKVDGGTAQTPANAEVTSGQTVECCVEGKSAKCLTPSSPSSLYCVDVTVPGTTTTTTTTTASTSTTTTTTPPPTTTTTTTIPSTTTPTSTTTTTATPTTTTTITTTPMPTTRTTTTTTPSSTARPSTQSPTTTPSTSTSSTPSTTTPSNTRGESNTSLIAMIVVVSVIGGILVIAIVFMILVMVYGKSGLPLSTRRKGTHHRPAADKHHRHHRHHKHHKSRERSEHSFYQPHNVLAGYSFYRGGVENPLFQESMDYPNTPVLYHKDANEMFHAPRYDEQPPEYQYAVNWEGLD